ncbi:cellulose biosynthesis protein BcsE [Litorivivens lipolytica]|uniref:Cellulose biosynthesis protein BcsE n=1 Tax=Litorivivens lipolytica TaxID=1524264 RepID=A0A7W4Z4Z0_9GAMM|nr:cellulose biosynthesis protein BcsE [Litorivivens lipolytica]MBB3046969.1 cellulose biosynthesis protein BcsE [Litorivivens lipolytica]
MAESNTLPVSLRSLHAGELYFCFTPALTDTATALIDLDQVCKRIAVVTQVSRDTYFGATSQAQHPALTNVFSRATSAWFARSDVGGSDHNFYELLRDVRRAHIEKKSLLVVVLEEAAFKSGKDERMKVEFERWREYARERSLSVLFLVSGEYSSVKPVLMRLNTCIAGLASLQTLGSACWNLQVYYWHTQSDVLADAVYELTQTGETQFELTEQRASTSSSITPDHEGESADHDAIYIAADAIDQEFGETDKNQFTLIADSNRELVDRLPDVESATVVFACTAAFQARDLASFCYTLRRKYGRNLKLIVRETTRCLRYTDEQLLLKAGANLILPHSVDYASFMMFVDSLRGQWFGRSLPPSLDDLLDSWTISGLSGFFEPETFVGHARHIFAISRQHDTESTLVALTPYSNISAEDCLSLCRIRREGDLITMGDGRLFILFRACRPADVGVALKKCFVLPVDDIFDSRQLFNSPSMVDDALGKIVHMTCDLDSDSGNALMQQEQSQKVVNAASSVYREDGLRLATRQSLKLVKS